jgi:hypothetical protein
MTDDVSKMVKQAAEAAKLAPKHLQEAAFNKAFDALVGGSTRQADIPQPPRKQRGSRTKKESPDPKENDVGNSLEGLDRTAHTDINHNDSALNNSLRLILAVKQDMDIDGLTATQIAKVLVDKFRCRITQQAVSMALNRAGRYVNRHKEGNLVIFRIMAPGEEYLAKSREKPEEVAPASRTLDRSKKKTSKTKAKKKAAKTITKRTGTRSVGSFAAVNQLYEAGFFSSARRIGNIIDHLKHQHGRTLKGNEISPALLRHLRTDKLTRKKNADNQYEYQQS